MKLTGAHQTPDLCTARKVRHFVITSASKRCDYVRIADDTPGNLAKSSISTFETGASVFLSSYSGAISAFPIAICR